MGNQTQMSNKKEDIKEKAAISDKDQERKTKKILVYADKWL